MSSEPCPAASDGVRLHRPQARFKLPGTRRRRLQHVTERAARLRSCYTCYVRHGFRQLSVMQLSTGHPHATQYSCVQPRSRRGLSRDGTPMRLRVTDASAESGPLPPMSAAFWGAGVGSGDSDICFPAAAALCTAAVVLVACRQHSRHQLGLSVPFLNWPSLFAIRHVADALFAKGRQ